MNRSIEIARHAEMAHVLLDGESVFSGNLWDFHAGCMGTTIAGYDLAGKWDEGVESLAYVLCVEIEREGHTVTRAEKELSDYDNDVLMCGKEYADKIAAGGYDEPRSEAPAAAAQPASQIQDTPLSLTPEQVEAIGDRECNLCGEDIAAPDWCVACAATHDESRCRECCAHGAAIQRRSLIEWLREYNLWPA